MSRFTSRVIWNGSKYWWKTFWGSKTCFKKYSSCKKYFSNNEEKVDIVKLDPVIRIAPGKNLEQQRKSFSTAKRKRTHNVKYAKPTDEEKTFMSQNMFAEEIVETDVLVRDTEEGAIKLTKVMTKLCFK